MKLIGLIKTLLVVAALAYVVVPTVAMAQNSVHCDDPNTGKKKWVKIWRIHAMYKDTSEILENEGIHILDLGEDDWKLRQELEGYWVGKNWCGVYVTMSALDRSLARVTLDADFTMSKFRRIEKWLRDGEFTPGQKMQGEKYLKQGANALGRGNLEKANQAFNKSLNLVFSLKDAFALPTALPKYQDPYSGGSTYDASDIEEACPELTGAVSQAKYLETVEKLRSVLDNRLVRPIDLGDSASLMADFSNYQKLNAVGPAARIACALMNKALEIEPDLASVIKRFRKVNEMRRATRLPEFRRLKFKDLVRQASDKLAVSDYRGAHASLDALFVLFGQPKNPSDYLLN